MKSVLPVIVVCSVGIAACAAYIVALCVKAIRRRPPRKRRFEIEEDVLTVRLDRRGKR